MTETVLYRKYRPKDFKGLYGQEHIVKALEGAISNERISHAYLFSGTRGIGKTSIARIFADAIGCAPKDLYEMDAASNRGIDDIRALRESVQVLPFESKYKVYIIDEVHMLTKDAFNALLKTLEEPPAHVVFILATTEHHKLPDTIVSRCQTFLFHKPSTVTLKKVVESVAKEEGFHIDPAAAELVSFLGDGSFRDTLGVLQKVIASSSGKKISVENVSEVTGAPQGEKVNAVLKGIISEDLASALGALRDARVSSTDMKIFLRLLLKKARAILLLRFAPEMKGELAEDFTEEDFSWILSEAQKKDFSLRSDTLKSLLDAYTDTERSALSELPLELALIRMIGEKKG